MKVYKNLHWSIISPDALFSAWEIFKRDKRNRIDVEEFEKNLERHIFQLHRDLESGAYRHGPYEGFWINDPTRRRIHKALVRDRVLHHALFRVLNPIFEPTFIPASFSCRVGKGTHKGFAYLTNALRAVSQNNTRPCFVLKCDVRKFFDSVDHTTLRGILEKRILDPDTRNLLREIISSYSTGFNERERERESKNAERKGVPIGNLTSQLFANVYLNELDQFVKHTLRVKYYARYTDDFVIVSESRKYLYALIPQIADFLTNHLHLSLHPDKVFIRKYIQGVDFLGYVSLPHHTQIRTKTKRRIFRKMRAKAEAFARGDTTEESFKGTLNSYLGALSHADAYRLEEELKNGVWFWQNGG